MPVAEPVVVCPRGELGPGAESWLARRGRFARNGLRPGS